MSRLRSLLSKECRKIIKDKDFNDKIVVSSEYWSCKRCNDFPKSLFLFGDNDQQKGIGGQATVRNCGNVAGIPTKKFPNNNPKSFYTDDDYDQNRDNIIKAVENIVIRSVDYDKIMFPADGFGTGLAKLPTCAPETYEFMNKLIKACFGVDYAKDNSESE